MDRIVGGLALTEYGTAAPAAGADAPVLVLLHSMTFSRRTWAAAGRVLGRTYRCLAVDLPGHGGSARADRFLTIPGMADSIAELLRSEGIGSAVIVGNSMGATVGVAMANQHPDLVHDLVLVGAALWDTEPQRRAWLTSRATMMFDAAGQPRQPGPEIVEQLFGTYDQVRYQLILDDHRDSAAALETSIWALYRYDVAHGLSKLRQPVLAVYGSNDPYLTPSGPVIRKHAGRLDEVVIEGGSHVLPVDKPAELSECVTGWLTAPGRQRP